MGMNLIFGIPILQTVLQKVTEATKERLWRGTLGYLCYLL
jgi:hypothetical protein